MTEKVGVYICHCGSNIAGTVDVEEVAKWAGQNIKHVAVSRDYKFMCSSLGQQMIEDDIKSKGKTAEDAYYHSLSKKSKSLNKKLRHLKRQQEKIRKAEEKKAKPPEEKTKGTDTTS